METKEIITLKEFQTKSLSKDMISEEVSEILKIKFHKQIDLLPPWVGTNFQWQVTSQGWVGFIPVTSDFSLSLLPKVPLKNLFGMLTYAFKLNVFFPEGEYQANTLQEFYDFLAGKLSEFVLTRARKGLFRDYLSRDSELPYVRGRINLRELIQSPWKININNHYQEHTADVEFNQILSYTLSIILRSGLCSKKVLPKIRSAHRAMSRYSRPIPFTSKESINFLYNRLNHDYQPMC
jgi:5-methylcytosine-specific restriction enzyme subunit McrC